MSKEVEVYVLTHKKIEEDYDQSLYKPLLVGSTFLEEDFGYLRDDAGDNISKYNKYLSEMTGEYWVWKHSTADIIGFCHYRRWFVNDFRFKKITEEDILNSLEEYDIILPLCRNLPQTFIEHWRYRQENFAPDYGAKPEDYEKLGEYIKNNLPEYYDSFNKIIYGKRCHFNAIFISSREFLDNYMEWLFSIFRGMSTEIDFDSYSEGNKRVFAFFSEPLLNIYVDKQNLKVKEYWIDLTSKRFPLIEMLCYKFPKLRLFEYFLLKLLFKSVHILKFKWLVNTE